MTQQKPLLIISFFFLFLSLSLSPLSPAPHLPKKKKNMLVQFAVFPQVSVSLPTSDGQSQNQQQPAFEVKTSSPGKALVEFRNTQTYSLPFSLTTVTLTCDTQLELDARSGKIERHVDRWRSVAGVGGGGGGGGSGGSLSSGGGAGGVAGRVKAMLHGGEKAD